MKKSFEKIVLENKSELPLFSNLLKKVNRHFGEESNYRQINSKKHQTSSFLIDDFYKSVSRPINMSNAQD